MGSQGQVTLRTTREKVVVRKRRLGKDSAAYQLEMADKRNHAMQLRRSGATYADIAKALGYASPSGAQRAVLKAVQSVPIDGAEDVIRLELERLDEIQARLMLAFRQGDLSQADRIMRVMQMRQNYLGLSPEDIGRTLKREDTQASSIVNNGVMVINGATEEDYVAQMRAAVEATGMNITGTPALSGPKVTSQGRVIDGDAVVNPLHA